MVTFGSEMVDPNTRRFCFPRLVFRHEFSSHLVLLDTITPSSASEKKNKNLPGNLIPQNPSKWMVRNPVFSRWGKFRITKLQFRPPENIFWVKVIISSICLLNIFKVGNVIQQCLFHLCVFRKSDQLELDFEGVGCFCFHPAPRLPNGAHASNIDLRDLLNIAQP